MNNAIREKLLSTKELAEYLGITEWTLAHYRMDGTGPEYIKLGHVVRYKINDVEKWLEAKKNEIRA
jgi:predicted DNA-binding transcriptional regulator AlpA